MTLRGCSVLLAVGLFSRPVFADTAERDAGRALFSAGRAAMRRGDRASACKMFRESHRVDSAAVGPMLNVAECDEERLAFVAAEALYGRALELLEPGDERVPATEARRAAVAAKVATVTLACPIPRRQAGCDVTQTTATLDGIPWGLGVSGARRVDPGTHGVRVRKPGHADLETSLDVAEGASVVWPLSVGPRLSLPSPPPVPAPASRHGATLALAGAGSASLAFGLIARLVAADYNREFRDHCVGLACDEQGLRAGDVGKTWTVLGTAGLLTGAVGLGACAVLFFRRNAGSSSAAPNYVAGEF